MHTTRTHRDWSIIQVVYPGKGVPTTDSTFKCTDGSSNLGNADSWEETTINLDQYQNCLWKNNDEGKSEIIEFEVDGTDG